MRNFIWNVAAFSELHSIPVDVFFPDHVDANDLFSNNAKWHLKCKLKFANTKLQRTQERHGRKRNIGQCGDDTGQRQSKRFTLPVESKSINPWNFCKKTEGILHRCTTLELDIAQRTGHRNAAHWLASHSSKWGVGCDEGEIPQALRGCVYKSIQKYVKSSVIFLRV